jgi:hypothetical protein
MVAQPPSKDAITRIEKTAFFILTAPRDVLQGSTTATLPRQFMNEQIPTGLISAQSGMLRLQRYIHVEKKAGALC